MVRRKKEPSPRLLVSNTPQIKADAGLILHVGLWLETIAKAEALRNLAATQRSEQDAARFIKRAEAEEDKARDYLKQAEILERVS